MKLIFVPQPDGSVIVKGYRRGRCYATRYAAGDTLAFYAHPAVRLYPYNETTGQFLPGKSIKVHQTNHINP
jgi:hypothetical protein